MPVARLTDEDLATAIAGLAALESSAAALLLARFAQADSRRVSEQTADTGTDAWLARLTGSTREAMAGGLRLATLLHDLRRDPRGVRRGPPPGRAGAGDRQRGGAGAGRGDGGQVRAAEELLVAKATGDGTRSGRPMDAKRLRQAARRMFDQVDRELADRHEAILLSREARTAEAETFLALHDNGDGSFSGRFRIPELHGHLLTQVLDRLTSPRRLCRDRSGTPVVDESAPGTTGATTSTGLAARLSSS